MLSPTFQSESVTASSCFSSTCSKRFRAMGASILRRDLKAALTQAAALARAGKAVAPAPDRRHEGRYPEEPDRLGEGKCCVIELALITRPPDDGESLIEFLGCLHRGETRSRKTVTKHHGLHLEPRPDHVRPPPPRPHLTPLCERC